MIWYERRLRYVKPTDDDSYMSLSEEVLEPATQYLQGAHLALLPESHGLSGKFGSEVEVQHVSICVDVSCTV